MGKRHLIEFYHEIYQSIIEHNPDAIFVIGCNGKITKVNPVATEVFGYSQKKIKNMHYQDFLIPEQLEKATTYFEQVLKGNAYEGEIDALHSSGEILHLRIKVIPLTIKGEIVSVFCVVKDNTDLLRTKKSLFQMEERFKAVFNSSVDAIDLVDLNGKVIDVNPGFEKLYGWKQDEVIGKPLPIIPSYGQEEVGSIIKRSKLGESFSGIKLDRIRKDGTSVKVSLTCSPVRDDKGEVIAVSGIARDITEYEKLQKNWEFLSFHDPLTNIPNRRLFKEKLEQALKEAERYNKKFAVLYVDVDHFKQINDTYGHDIGDQFIRQFTKRIQEHLRESDTLSRQGGDEFAILLPEIQEELDVVNIAQRILISTNEPWQIDHITLRTTTSIGIALYPKDGITRHILMRHADRALYEAKEKGRNNFKLYDSSKDRG